MSTQLHSRIFAIFFLLLIFTGFYALTYTSGPPSGCTNAPGESNCTSCHNGTIVTSGSNWNNIILSSNIPATGYVPDSIYTMTLSHTQSGISKFGFQITALKSPGNTKAGTLIITNSSRTQLLTGTRDYVEHTSTGTLGSGSISWSFNWKAPATNIGDIIFYAAINASNNNNSSSGDMILAKSFTYHVSTLLPTAVITVIKDTVCAGDTVFLYGSGANSPTTWTWTMSGGTPATSANQNPFVVYKNAGTYSVTLVTTNIRGTSPTTTLTLYVIAKPTVGISPSGPIGICQGDSVMLNAVAGKSLAYLWNTNETTAVIYVKTAGTYYVTVTNSSGCSEISKPVTVIVYSLPSVILTSSPDTICKGTAVQFSANPSDFKNYMFKSGSAILQNSTKNNYSTSALTNGTPVYVTVKDSNNCTANSNPVITTVVNPLDTPKVICGTQTTSTIDYNWTTVSNALSYEVSEDSGKTWITPSSGPTGLIHEVYGLTFSESIMLYVRAKDNYPCLYSPVSKLTCTTLACSPIYYKFVYDSILCKGESTSINLHEINTTKYSINFENQGFTKDTAYPVLPASSKIYTLLLIDSNALYCPAIIIKAKIRVSPLPDATLNSDKKDDAVCKGDSILLNATPGYANYLYVKNNKDTLQNSVVETYRTKILSDGDVFKVITSNKDGCSAPGKDIKVTVYPLPLVGFSFVQAYLQFTFTDTTRHAALWKWDFGDSQTDSVKSLVHIYASAGLYDVKLYITDSNGCTGNTVKKVNAIVNSLDEQSVTLYNVRYIGSQKNVEVHYELASPATISINLLNQAGKIIKVMQFANQKQGIYNIIIHATDLIRGVYIISLNNGSSIRSKKVFIY